MSEKTKKQDRRAAEITSAAVDALVPPPKYVRPNCAGVPAELAVLRNWVCGSQSGLAQNTVSALFKYQALGRAQRTLGIGVRSTKSRQPTNRQLRAATLNIISATSRHAACPLEGSALFSTAAKMKMVWFTPASIST